MRLTSLILALLLVGGLYWWFALRGPVGPVGGVPGNTSATAAEAASQTAAERDRPVEVVVITSRAAPVADTLTLRGRTLPNRRVAVTAETEGLVISEPPRRGARVEAGDVLCQLDPGARPSALHEAEAGLAGARIEAEAAERLSERGFTPETTLAARRAALQGAEARVEQIELDIARLEMHAPFAGTLEEDAAETGSRLGIGEVCARLVDLDRLKVAGFVSELAVERIALGQQAAVRLVTGGGAEGQITYIAPVADPDTRTFEVEVTLANPEGRIRAGMTASIEIALPAVEAHRLPQSALTLDDEGRMGVRVAEDGRARFYPVEIMREAAAAIWVTGLPGEAEVIVAGQEFVRAGRAVAPVPLEASALR
ncbi:MAG TPA: efflux RND transporter periplasmic adaptor subunit [Thermohalobaculum sp.]|nr:efflux RND transporter periplasmic adaptor subunit [Thermohalobaculum sp.]